MPAVFTGLLSQLDHLASIYSRPYWLKRVRTPIKGVHHGVLPPALLAAITFLLLTVIERLNLE